MKILNPRRETVADCLFARHVEICTTTKNAPAPTARAIPTVCQIDDQADRRMNDCENTRPDAYIPTQVEADRLTVVAEHSMDRALAMPRERSDQLKQ